MSSPQHEARQRPALIPHDTLDQHEQPTRRMTLGLAIVALAIVPAVFWGSVAWLVWGAHAAAIATIVVVILSVFIMGLLRSAGEVETPAPAAAAAPWPAELGAHGVIRSCTAGSRSLTGAGHAVAWLRTPRGTPRQVLLEPVEREDLGLVDLRGCRARIHSLPR